MARRFTDLRGLKSIDRIESIRGARSINMFRRSRRICCSLILALSSSTTTLSTAAAPAPEAAVDLNTVEWLHGAEDCAAERHQADYLEWQQVRYQSDTYILRQNKCSNYEAPFVYFLIGSERALLVDTGATVAGGTALLQALRSISDLPITVMHSHGHGDHRQGDDALRSAAATEVVGIGASAVREFFGFQNWPEQSATYELGGRPLVLLPIPGHSDDDLALYDPQTQLLITGDTLYPGRLYISDWPQYRASVLRLAAWIRSKPVAHVLGTHIEMTSTPDVDYPIRTTYQPDEHPLPLTSAAVASLARAVAGMVVPQRTYLKNFILWPD